MAKIISNEHVGENIYLLKIEGQFTGEMGQFYMLRAWEQYPVLSRPLSIHNLEENSISFLYAVVGEGTQILSRLTANHEVRIEGPYGNGFPRVEGKVALVGGGMGVAPLYLAAKNLKGMEGVKELDIYMGFREKVILEETYKACADRFTFNVGGKITDDLDVSGYDYIFTCGPELMMKQIVKMAKKSGTKVYVSIEKRMACGVGACLVCTCKTKGGNKKTCKDGPVFLGEDVYDV
jgi:dihydroorotate dehydrogenase electron transfer subunit